MAAGNACISVKVKFDVSKILDSWIVGRKAFLSELEVGSDKFMQAEELIRNLESTKRFLEEAPTCEEIADRDGKG